MTDISGVQRQLHYSMTNSPNWRQPGQTIVPLVPAEGDGDVPREGRGMMSEQSNEQRYYDALRRIAKDYMTPAQIARDAGQGFAAYEYLEMAYENIQEEARRAIKGRRRPSPAQTKGEG